MRIEIVGGGPGGLYAAILLKKSDPSREIVVYDRNPPDATYGWGVVFSDETLTFLEESDPPTFAEIARSFVRWEAIDIRYRHQTVRSAGHAFSGMARTRLLAILQQRCRDLAVDLRFGHEVSGIQAGEWDLVIAADGLNSHLRASATDVFRPSFDVHHTKYIWLGCPVRLEAFTFDFRLTDHGMFQVHAYPFDLGMSTVIVECSDATWRRAGLEVATEEQSLDFCQILFADLLQGRPLLSNRSSWISFTTLRNQTWRRGNLVLLGDAAHTAHFSIGSGTKLAMEDAIALAQALDKHRTVPGALLEYEELRQPVVDRTQLAARESSMWFEHTDRYSRFEPTQFAFSLLTRSKRVTYENLRLRDPVFSREVDSWFATHAACAGTDAVHEPPQPADVPIRLARTGMPNRLVASASPAVDAPDGMPREQHRADLTALARGRALILTDSLAISLDGRITPGDTGLWTDRQREEWRRIVRSVREATGARVGARLLHAGRRGATRLRREGVDLPLRDSAWPLVAASALPYTRYSQTPRAMSQGDLDRVCWDFVAAAIRAREAAFDLLELHFGHGYLVAGFLSPLTNRRADAYGGRLENRLRFPLRILRAVRQVWPEGIPLAVCLTVSDWAPGGITETDAVTAARAMAREGCDLIHVVTGQTTAESNAQYGRAWQARFSDLIRNEAGVPTLVVGRITNADEVNTLLAAGRADLCLVTPDWTRETPLSAVPPQLLPSAQTR